MSPSSPALQPNPDPALDPSHQHHHQHVHHATGGVQDVSYTKNTTNEPSIIPDPDPLDNHHRGILEKTGNTKVSDEEKGGSYMTPTGSHQEVETKSHRFGVSYRTLRPFVHAAVFIVFTGWWIAGLILHRYDIGWLIPFLLWLAITLRLITFYVPAKYVLVVPRWIWVRTIARVPGMLPEKARTPLAGLLVAGVYIIGAFASPESQDNTRANRAVSLFGLVVLMAVLYATSRDRSKIPWHTVIVGMLAQFIIALFVLRSQAGFDIFNFISSLAVDLLGFANQGTDFLTEPGYAESSHWFLITVVPAIIFFISFVQLLYYWGILQWFIGKMAIFFFWSMKVSGAEAVVASASPFIGQGESAILIKPFIAHLTMAEIHQIMTSGFATIAGSVLIAYISFGVNPQALVSSCVMSIPASLAISKMRYPETEDTLTSGRVVIPDDEEHRSANALHAFANGAWLGLKVGIMIAGTLLCILALLGLANGLLTWWGHYLNIPELTIQLVLGYLCYPVAFLLGVPREGNNILLVGQLIGTKIVTNEFVAYQALVDPKQPYLDGLSPRSKLIATYALCGFGNIGSLGNQIGVLNQLAPGRSGDVSRVAVSALLAGVLSTLTSASVAGMLVTDQASFLSSAVQAS